MDIRESRVEHPGYVNLIVIVMIVGSLLPSLLLSPAVPCTCTMTMLNASCNMPWCGCFVCVLAEG